MIDLSGVELITFDCYGTLIDWETGILSYFDEVFSKAGRQVESSRLLSEYAERESRIQAGEYKRYSEILDQVANEILKSNGLSAHDPKFTLSASIGSWLPFPDTVAALTKLKRKFRLGIISNIDDALLEETLARLNGTIDCYVTAQQARAYKPSPEIFSLAARQFQASRENWLHAAQSLYHDIVPARALGVRCVWVDRQSIRPGAGATPQAAAQADARVSSLSELATLLCV